MIQIEKTTQLTAALFAAALGNAAAADVIVGTDFTGRTFSGNVVTVNDYTVNGVANPGDLTFTGPSDFMTSADATDKAVPIRNAPNWSVLIPLSVGDTDIDLENVTVSFEAFGNSQVSKTGISGGFSPNYQPTVRLLNASSSLIKFETQDAWGVNGDNLVAAWTPVFTFVINDTLKANTDYFLEIEMTGSGGNNVGIDSLAINGVVPEPGSLALLGLGGLLIARRRRG